MRISSAAAWLLALALAVSPAALAADVPAQFPTQITGVQGDFLEAYDGSDQVYHADGAQLLPDFDTVLLDGDYLKVLNGDRRWQIYRTDETAVSADSWDQIDAIYGDLAIVSNGTWHPPGVLYGSSGAVDLTTGKLVVPISYSQLRFSADGAYLVGTTDAGYTVFDRSGSQVSVQSVALEALDGGQVLTLAPATGKFGLADSDGSVLIPAAYDQILTPVLSGAAVVRSGDRYGAVAIDGSGRVLQAVTHASGAAYSNDLYALGNGNSIAVYYGDGGTAIPAGTYARVSAMCGDALFLERTDGALTCVSKTGQPLGVFGSADRSSSAYVSFQDDDCDFVLLSLHGDIEADSIYSPTAVVNRWGEVVLPYANQTILSDGAVGVGCTMIAADGATTHLMADGTRLAIPADYAGIDYNNGWVVCRDGDTMYLAGFSGKVLIPAGRYADITLVDGGASVKTPDGKYGLIELEPAPLSYQPHSWAEVELEAAIDAGILPEDQQRDWRDSCTRGDFCRMLMAMADAAGMESGPSDEAFSDTDDPAILDAAALGIVHGVGGGCFAPNRPVTRQEAAVMLARAADCWKVEATGAAKSFSDAGQFAGWAVDGIARATGLGVMQGVSDTRFAPKNTYTREQAVLTIYRLYQALA